MTQELLLSARRLLKTPSFTALALLCIALGIGANVAVFTVLSSVLLRPLPFADAGRLAMVFDTHPGPSADEEYEVSPPNFAAWQAKQTPFTEIAAWVPRTYSLTGAGEPERIVGAEVSADLLHVLGVAPRLGRAFSRSEDTPPGVAVAILSDGLWRDHFGAAPDILRRQLRLDGKSYAIAGVMPPGFNFPDQSRLWTPLALDPYKLPGRQFHTLYVAGRLRPGRSHPQAQLAMTSLARELARQFPDSNAGWGVKVKTMREHLTGDVRPALLFLQGAVCLVLLIACVNVANLMLARFEGRRSEFAVRAALGETRRRLVRQLLVESAILSFAGGALGVAFGWFGLRALLPLIPPTLLPVHELSFDPGVLGYALLAILAVNAIIGLVPAFTRSESDLRSGLGEDGRKASAGRRRRLLLSSLVVAEIAIAMTLLVAAGLLTRSFLELQKVHLGYDPVNLLTMRIAFPGEAYPDRDRKIHLLQDALARIEALPGVGAAAVSMVLPVGDEDVSAIINVEGRPPAMPGEVLLVNNRFVSPHYFQTMRIPLLQGRGISEADRADTQLVVVVSKAMAKAFWPGQNPLGKRVRRGWAKMVNPWFTVVGVVDDVQDSSLDAKIGATWYLAFTQTSWPEYSLAVRTAGKPEALAAPVRRIFRSLDPELPVGQIKTMEQRLAESLGKQRFSALLLAIFTGLGLVLAAAGLYGLMSYSVRQRTHELGVRMALGAPRRTVLSLVLRQGTLLVAAGLVLGAVLLVLLIRLIGSFLFNVSPVDPLSVGGAALLLLAVALLASLFPAVRATRIDLVDCFPNQYGARRAAPAPGIDRAHRRARKTAPDGARRTVLPSSGGPAGSAGERGREKLLSGKARSRTRNEGLGLGLGGEIVYDEKRKAQRHQASGAIVFYRREQEAVEREHLGILENIGAGGLLLATGEDLPAGTLLLMRIYSQVAPAGHSEVTVRGTVQRHSETPKGVGIRFLDTGARCREELQELIAALSPAHPAAMAGMALHAAQVAALV